MLELEHQRNGHHVHLAADGIREFVERKQRRERGIGERTAAGDGQYLPLQVVIVFGGLARAYESAPAVVDA